MNNQFKGKICFTSNKNKICLYSESVKAKEIIRKLKKKRLAYFPENISMKSGKYISGCLRLQMQPLEAC